MMNSRLGRAAAVLAAAAVLTLTLTGCSAIERALGGVLGEGDAQRDETGSVQAESDIGIFNLKVGDCKMEDTAGEISGTKVVPCADSHDEEVFDEFMMDEGEFPGADAIQSQTEEVCSTSFAEFVGVAWEDSELDFFGIQPTQATWDEYDDRAVLCVIWDPSGPVAGTLAGAQR